MDVILFLLFAFIAVAAGINLVVQTHPISSALSLIGVMGSLAVLYLLLGGEFIAAAQLVVYAGAIMVLFVFVIMLLNAGTEKKVSRGSYAKYFGVPLLTIFLGLISFIIQAMLPASDGVQFGKFTDAAGKALGGAEPVGERLFTAYLLPFEITSVLILIAILGAIVLARKEIE
jgi:NADH-quinone oxidoreductase subunit J